MPKVVFDCKNAGVLVGGFLAKAQGRKGGLVVLIRLAMPKVVFDFKNAAVLVGGWWFSRKGAKAQRWVGGFDTIANA